MSSTTLNTSTSLPSTLLTPSTTTASISTSPAPAPSSAATPLSPPVIYPREYAFPPFFTRQPNATTYSAQAGKWSSWILAYCRHHRLFKLSLADAVDSDLFWNKALGKRLGLQDARELLEGMRAVGRVEWVVGDGEARNVCWVWWRDPEEWAVCIAEWVEETGQKNTVLTLYELTESEATIGQDFHGMDPEVLQKALNVLVKRGKAQVFGEADSQGVKFF